MFMRFVGYKVPATTQTVLRPALRCQLVSCLYSTIEPRGSHHLLGRELWWRPLFYDSDFVLASEVLTGSDAFACTINRNASLPDVRPEIVGSLLG